MHRGLILTANTLVAGFEEGDQFAGTRTVLVEFRGMEATLLSSRALGVDHWEYVGLASDRPVLLTHTPTEFHAPIDG